MFAFDENLEVDRGIVRVEDSISRVKIVLEKGNSNYPLLFSNLRTSKVRG